MVISLETKNTDSSHINCYNPKTKGRKSSNLRKKINVQSWVIDIDEEKDKENSTMTIFNGVQLVEAV